jgi:peroxiredoxin
VSTRYGAWALKTNYGKTYMGIIRSSFLIDDAASRRCGRA